MKKIIALFLVMTMSLGGVGCGEKTAEVTFPANFFESVGNTDLEGLIENGDFESYVVNEDGSITVEMSEENRNNLLLELRAGIDEDIETVKQSGSVLEVEMNEDMTEFIAYVDSEKYSMFDSISLVLLYYGGIAYQTVAGVPAEEINVLLTVTDKNSGEILSSQSYKEFFESFSG